MVKKLVYAVEHGHYSDYGIDAMFSTKALALKAAKAINGDDRVVAYEVFDEVPERRWLYVKQMGDNGTVTDAAFLRWPWEGNVYVGRMTRGVGFGRWKNWANQDCYRFWGEDKDRVHKAFDDFRAQGEAIDAGVADGPFIITLEPED